jgi:type II secretory pathway pseudopilin PulG
VTTGPLRPSSSLRRARPRPAPGRVRGAILLRLSAGLFVLSLAAALAVPAWQRTRLNDRVTATVTDLTRFAEALRRYAHERRDWPLASAEPGAVPAGAADYLPADHWQKPTPLGGRYLWARETLQRGERYQAALVLADTPSSRVSSDRRLLAAVDHAIDDGNLDTGKFRLGFRLQPVFVLEH